MASVSPPSIIVVVSPAAAAPAGSGSGASGGASGGSSTGASTSSMPAPFKALQQTFSNGLQKLDEATQINEQKWLARANTLRNAVPAPPIQSVASAAAAAAAAAGVTTASGAPQPPAVKVEVPPAAADILYKYENHWVRLHRDYVDIAQNAATADTKIQKMLKSCDEQRSALDRFATQLKTLPTLLDAVGRTTYLLGEITKRIEATEALFTEISRYEDAEAHNRWAFTQINETEAYMQNKRREQKVHEFNFKKAQADIDKAIIAEKQRLAEEEFEKQIDEFRKEGKVRSVSVSSGKSVHEEQEDLAKVGVDVKPEEAAALSDFLEATTTDEAATSTPASVPEQVVSPQVGAEQEVHVITTEESPETITQ